MKLPSPLVLLSLLAVAALSCLTGYRLGVASRSEPAEALRRGSGAESYAIADEQDSVGDEREDLAEEYPNSGDGDGFAYELSQLSAADAPALFERLREGARSGDTNGRLRSLFRAWGAIDPQAAIEAARSFPGRERLRYLSLAAAGWATKDPAAAWDFAMVESSNGRVRSLELDPIIRAMAREDAAAALGKVLELSGPDALRSGVNALARAAADQGAFDETYRLFSRELKDEELRLAGAQTLFRRWSATDADASLAAISRISDSEERDAAMRGFYQGWAETDSLSAYEYLLDHYEDPVAAESARAIGRELARTLTASELLGALEMGGDSAARQAIAAAIISDVARADPAVAVQLAEQEPDPRRRAQQTQNVLREWVATDFDGAARYFLSLEDDAVKSRAISAFFDRSSLEANLSRNPEDAGRYLNLVTSLQNEKARAESLKQYAQIARRLEQRGQSALAARMASGLQTSPLIDDRLRQRLLERIYAAD